METWKRRLTGPLLQAAAAGAGLVLFVYAVRAVGSQALADGIARVGWGMAPILALAGVRFMLRAQCWRLCMPPASRLPFGRAFTAFLAGDAVGNLTPLGLAASEPAKVVLARGGLATAAAISSLAVDNLVYLASAIAVVALGALLLIATVDLPFDMLQLAVAIVALGVAGLGGALLLLRGMWSPADGQRPPWRERLAGVRQSVLRFSAANPAQIVRVFGIHLGFHALSMVENYLTLQWVMGARPTIAQAVVFEALNRVLTLAFKFVPFRVGVDEAASAQLAVVLGIPPVAAVAGAVIRKIRNLFWTGIGLALIAASRGQAGPAMDPRGSGSVHPT